MTIQITMMETDMCIAFLITVQMDVSIPKVYRTDPAPFLWSKNKTCLWYLCGQAEKRKIEPKIQELFERKSE